MIQNNIIYTKFKENKVNGISIFLELTKNQKIKKMPSEILSKPWSKKMRFFVGKNI